MKHNKTTTTDALEKLFHEPNRLSIMSSLCAADKGMAFTDLKATCGLTDGNLNRHLKVLSENRVVTISKTFVKDKPRTTVRLSALGLKRFSDYIAALESVLQQARAALAADQPAGRAVPLTRQAIT